MLPFFLGEVVVVVGAARGEGKGVMLVVKQETGRGEEKLKRLQPETPSDLPLLGGLTPVHQRRKQKP